MQFYFIRHGQSENNALWDRAGPRQERSPDPELTELGHQQAQWLARFLAEPGAAVGPPVDDTLSRLANPYLDDSPNVDGFPLTHLYCSPMIRAIDTGTYVAQALGLPLVVWEDLHELGGIFREGEETGQEIGLPGNDRAYLKERYPNLALPNGWGKEGWWNRPFEQREQRLLRAQRFFRDLMCRHGGSDDRVAVVSHAGFFNHFLVVALDWPARGRNGFQLNNAAITRIDFGEYVRVVYTNRVDFLPWTWIS